MLKSFNHQGQNLNNFTKKGDKILIKGSLETNEYQDKNGQSRKAFEVIVSEFELMQKPDKPIADEYSLQEPQIQNTQSNQQLAQTQNQDEPIDIDTLS